jgi:MFS family permease
MVRDPHRRELRAVDAAGLVQGLALVTFPSAASVLTSPDGYDLSSSAYGALFLPQAALAVVGSLAGGPLGRRLGPRRVLLAGLTLDLAAMLLLVTSQVGMGDALGFVMLLVATASLGLGFGLTVPTLDTLAAGFAPDRADRVVLVLNALLGLGTALAPLLGAFFLAIDLWWGLPALVALGLAVVLAVCARLPLVVPAPGGSVGPGPTAAPATAPAQVSSVTAPGRPTSRLPARGWFFVAFAFLYGIVETVNGNWATVYMTSDLGASASAATFALAAFWAWSRSAGSSSRSSSVDCRRRGPIEGSPSSRRWPCSSSPCSRAARSPGP